MTPHELNLHVSAYGERLRRSGRDDMTAAYLTAYWQRVKRMPDLKKLLEQDDPRKVKKEQSDEQMLAMVKNLHAAFGGETTGA